MDLRPERMAPRPGVIRRPGTKPHLPRTILSTRTATTRPNSWRQQIWLRCCFPMPVLDQGQGLFLGRVQKSKDKPTTSFTSLLTCWLEGCIQSVFHHRLLPPSQYALCQLRLYSELGACLEPGTAKTTTDVRLVLQCLMRRERRQKPTDQHLAVQVWCVCCYAG